MFFLLKRILPAAILAFALAGLAGCGEGSETNTPSTPLTAVKVTSSTTSSHSHTVDIPVTGLTGSSTINVRSSITSGHSHVIALSAGQLADLNKGYRVEVTSTPAADGHTHVWNILGGTVVYDTICYGCHSNDKLGKSQMNSSQPPLQSQKDALGNPSGQPLSPAVSAAPDPNYGAPSITTATLNAGIVGTPYSQSLAASGGTSPYTWSITSGALPAGLTLTNGVISGTPTAVGSSAITVKVVDSAAATASVNLTLLVKPAGTAPTPVVISPTTLSAATVGTSYTQSLTATGGTSPYTWSITSGALPAGLSFSNGIISGTPTATAASYSFTVKAADSASPTATATQGYALVLNAAAVQPALNTLTPNCATACHGLPPTTVVSLSGAVAVGMPHTTNTKCGTCHLIGGWVAGTTTFNMSGVTTHNNGTINFLAGLPTANCGACHSLPPTSGGHPSVATKSYVANCGICHVVGAGNPITMGISTHNNGTINFNP